MELLTNLESWHWMSLGIVLLICEVLGAAGFLLGLGFGAICVSLIMVVAPDISWQLQFTLFGVFSVVATWMYWKKFRAINQQTDQPLLNERAARLVGRRVNLLEAVVNGKGKIQVEDALWSVSAEQDLPEGASVEIIGVDGMTLLVKEWLVKERESRG